jgi:hypothetical protein
LEKCPECGGMSMLEVAPDNGYGTNYQCVNCGYENESAGLERMDAQMRMQQREQRRARKKNSRR